jgi:hypothetical protein
VQPQDKRVQLRVIARGRGDIVDLRQPGIRQRPPGGRQAARLGHLLRRVVRRRDQPIIHGPPVQATQGGHQVLFGAAAAASVASGHHVGLDVDHQLPDLRRRGLIQAPVAPVLDDPIPVGAVGPAGPGADRRRHDRDVLCEGRNVRAVLRDGSQVRRVRPIRPSSTSAASTTASWEASGFTAVMAASPRRGPLRASASPGPPPRTSTRPACPGRATLPGARGRRRAVRSGGATRPGSRCTA